MSGKRRDFSRNFVDKNLLDRLDFVLERPSSEIYTEALEC